MGNRPQPAVRLNLDADGRRKMRALSVDQRIACRVWLHEVAAQTEANLIESLAIGATLRVAAKRGFDTASIYEKMDWWRNMSAEEQARWRRILNGKTPLPALAFKEYGQ